MNNPSEQAGLLTECSSVILRAQPVLALQMLRLALLLAPRENSALRYAKEIFKRRGRWAAEQTVAEILATATQATAVSPSPVGLIDANSQPTELHSTRTTVSANDANASLDAGRDDILENQTQMELELNGLEQLQTAAIHSGQEPNEEVNAQQIGFSDVYSVDPIEAGEPSDAPAIAEVEVLPHRQQGTQSAVDAGSSNLFEEYINRCGFDPDWMKFSTGFSHNTFGLVAFVNLLMTMQLVSENRKTEALLTLLKIINEFRDDSGGDKLFDRLFMQRSQRGEA